MRYLYLSWLAQKNPVRNLHFLQLSLKFILSEAAEELNKDHTADEKCIKLVVLSGYNHNVVIIFIPNVTPSPPPMHCQQSQFT